MVNSFFAQAFLSIQEKIKAIPGIEWIDQDLGQLEHYDQRPPVKFPCVLIDFPDANFKEMSGYDQFGDLVLQLRIGFAPFTSANSVAPTSFKESALGYYELENAIFQALHGWTPTYNGAAISQALSRTRAATEERQDTYRVRVNHYTTAFEDRGAMPTSTRVRATMNIQPQ